MATRVARASSLSPETTRLLDEIGRLSQVAVREAREENRRRGIPNVQVEDGWIVDELPDGTVKRRRKLPPPTKPVKYRKS